MSELHLFRRVGRPDKGHSQARRCTNTDGHAGASGRLPSGRRDPWPEHVDPAALDRGPVPGAAVQGPAVGPRQLRGPVLKAVPVLGVR